MNWGKLTQNRSLDHYLNAALNKPAAPKLKGDLTIGRLAKETGETVATVRFWTEEGLLKIAGKTSGGYQLFGRDQISRINLIRKLQKEERLTIKEIKERFPGT